MPRLLTGTFTTAAFVRSSFRQFGASPYRAAPKDLPSSFAQHGAIRAFLTHRHLYPGHRIASNQVSAMLFPESGGAPVLMPSVDPFRGLISGSLAFVSLTPVS